VALQRFLFSNRVAYYFGELNLKRLLFFMCLLSMVSGAQAGYIDGQDLNRVYVGSDGFAYFGTTVQPTGTCYYFGEYIRFDAKSDAGKAMLGVLLSAKAAQRKITVWYTDSTTAGTTHANGCTPTTMSVATGIGFNQ
jgi:hypothetical protein